jgi:fibronectin type 3 domain-containing protein
MFMAFVMLVTLTTSLTPVMAEQASSDVKTTIDGLITSYVPSVTQTTTTSGDVTFTHPGIGMSKAMLDNMRDHVRALDEPWASAFVKFSRYGKSSINPVIRVSTSNDNYMNIPGGNLGLTIINNMEGDADTSFAQMIMWYITGNETYRRNAIRIIRDWSQCQSIGSVFDEQIRVSLAVYKFSFTADLLRYSDTPTPAYKWTSSDTTNFINFLTLMKPKYDRYWHFMNQHTFTVMGTIGSAIFRDDPVDYKNAIKRITTNPELGSSYDYTDPANPHNRGGSILDEIRAVTKNVKTGEAVPENIQVMEMGRDQAHSYVDIGGLSTVAMTAYIQGTKVDPSSGEYSTAPNSVHVFNFGNDRILAGANYLCKYNLWNDVTYIPSYANQTSTGQIFESPTTWDRGKIDPAIGIVYSYYKYIEQRSDLDTNENSKYLAQAFAKIYPEGASRDFFGDSVLLMTLEVPAVPTGVSAKAVSGSQISLGWTAASNATGYNIKRAAASGGPYTTIATGVMGTSYTDSGLTPGTAYYYVVSAVNLDNESSNSAETSATLPIAQLKFNETSGTTAADATGSNWNGTLVNGPVWAAGKSGNALDLDGTNDYVSLPAGVVASSATSTIAAWVNLDTVSNWMRIFDFGSGTSTYMFLSPKSGSGKIRFAIKNNGSSEQIIDGTSALATGGWHHVAVTLNGATGTLYVDGAQVGRNTAMTLKPSDMGSTTQNWIGRSQFSPDPYLNGRVDDFRIYNKALSASEVAALADMFAGPQNLSASANLLQTTLSWSAVADATSYNIKRSTVSGGPYTTIATGVTGTSFTDTGVTTDTKYYYVFSAVTSDFESDNSAEASSVVLAAPQNLTASANLKQVALSWSAVTNATSYNIKRAAASDVGPYTTIATGVSGTSFSDTALIPGTTYFYVVSAVNSANESGNSTKASALILTAPQNLTVRANESQAALSWNSVANAASYNVKRAAASGGPYTTIATGVTGTTYTDTSVTNGTTYYYVVSAVNSTNESINSAEVRANIDLLAAYLKFDETSGTTAADAIGNGWVGTLVNGPLWVAGISGNAVKLDGANDYVALPAGVVASSATSTIAAWVNLDAVSNWNRIFDFGSGTSTYMYLTPKNGVNGKIRFVIKNNNSSEQQIDGTAALPTGGWHHVAVTLDGATGILYVDGNEVGRNSAMTLKPSDLGSTTQNWIGRSQYNDPYLNGKIDDFKIYSRALSASDVVKIMNGQM